MPEYYLWNGWAAEVEVYDTTDGGGAWCVDVLEPDHPTGEIPEGEIQYMIVPAGFDRSSGWWTTEEQFWQHAEPLGPAAMKRAAER